MGKECGDKSFITPPTLFEITKPFIFVEITKPFIFVEIPNCELNEIKSNYLLKKFHKLINNSFRVVITWKARDIRSLLPLKEKKRL